MRAPLASSTNAKFFEMPHPICAAAPGPDSVEAEKSSERMLDASNERPSMSPDVLTRDFAATTARFAGCSTRLGASAGRSTGLAEFSTGFDDFSVGPADAAGGANGDWAGWVVADTVAGFVTGAGDGAGAAAMTALV